MELPHPGIKLGSSALQADSLPTELSGKLLNLVLPSKSGIIALASNSGPHKSILGMRPTLSERVGGGNAGALVFLCHEDQLRN